MSSSPGHSWLPLAVATDDEEASQEIARELAADPSTIKKSLAEAPG
jgi:hypothetical protein